jgi:hypothetical protein
MGGTAEEKARVVEGSMAYAGPLQLPWRPCVHHVKLSLFPN